MMPLIGRPLNGRPSYLAQQEFSRRVAKVCCVQVEGNWFSGPAALVRQNATVQSRDQQVLIRQGARIVARHTRQPANQRSRQVIACHWAGLVPQRAIESAQVGGDIHAGMVELNAVQRLHCPGRSVMTRPCWRRWADGRPKATVNGGRGHHHSLR